LPPGSAANPNAQRRPPHYDGASSRLVRLEPAKAVKAAFGGFAGEPS
jgi:hypothetical protein